MYLPKGYIAQEEPVHLKINCLYSLWCNFVGSEKEGEMIANYTWV